LPNTIAEISSGAKTFVALTGFNGNVRFGVLLDHFEREEFDVILYGGVAPFATDQTFGVEHGVLGVGSQLVLGGVADQALPVRREGHVGGSDAVTLVVGDYLDATVFVHPHAKKKSFPLKFNPTFHITVCCDLYVYICRLPISVVRI
jgi:hypothetical protein